MYVHLQHYEQKIRNVKVAQRSSYLKIFEKSILIQDEWNLRGSSKMLCINLAIIFGMKK